MTLKKGIEMEESKEKTVVTPTTNTPENGGQEQKTFTQEELNTIVETRLAKAKKDMPSKEELKKYNEWKEAQKTEQEKAAEKSAAKKSDAAAKTVKTAKTEETVKSIKTEKAAETVAVEKKVPAAKKSPENPVVYDENSILHLEGLEHIRLRPGIDRKSVV